MLYRPFYKIRHQVKYIFINNNMKFNFIGGFYLVKLEYSIEVNKYFCVSVTILK